MTAEAYDIVLQAEDADGGFRCRGFAGVPAASRSWIAIVSSGGTEGRASVGQLATEIEDALLGSSPEVTVCDIDGSLAPPEIKPENLPDRLKLLIVVGAGDHKIEDRSWYHTWQSDEHESGLMIVLPSGAYESFFDESLLGEEKATHLLRRINTATWSEKIAEILPSVFGRAEITSSINRIFISYRRLETLPLALQLFEALVEARFDVFLDRFSIPPGYDFQRRLTQELEDKSMVVLLESRLLKTSKWTQHEIDFAKRRRLGMIALRMPDVEDRDLLASVTPDLRVPLEKPGFKAKGPVKVTIDKVDIDQWQELEPDTLVEVIREIKKTHALALFRRRHRLRIDIVSALKAKGVDVQHSAVGALNIVRGDETHVIWPTARPPEIEDFRSVYGARVRKDKEQSARSSATIVGPLAALEPDRQRQLDWLRDVSACKVFDEGNLPEFVAQFGSGEKS